MSEFIRLRVGMRSLLTCAAIVLIALSGCVTSGSEAPRQSNPKADAAREVGIDHLAKGRLAMSIRQLSLSESLQPDDPQTQHWLSEAYRRKGRLDQAELHARAALALDPGYHQARLNLSALYAQMERYDETIVESNILFDDPLFAQPWRALNNRGWAQYKLGEMAEARASFDEALTFRPHYWPAVLNLGIVESDTGNHLLAIDYFDQVVSMDLGYDPEAEANFRLGELYVTMGNRSKALSHFDAALASSPDGSWGKQSKRYLELLR
jgi:tetratricopeptide (TPR) repeat protein